MKSNGENGIGPVCQTGIPGLDAILNGGFPRNRLYLIKGDPGVGKTTLALQFLLEGARRGETSLYVTLSESAEELTEVSKSHGWDISGLHLFELSTLEDKVSGAEETTFFHPSEVELNRTTKILLETIEEVKPVRLVFDSLSEMRLLAETPLRYRRQVLQLKQFFCGRNITVLLLDDRSAADHDLQVESIAHGVISLERMSPEYGVSRRQLHVLKVRGAKFVDGFHDFTIEQGGVVVYPRLVAAEHHREFQRDPFSCGIAELDALMGGGLDRGTSTMFMGPPGTGKSTLAAKFAAAAAERGEKVLFFLFDETVGTFVHRADQLDFGVKPHIESGVIRVEQVDPAEISPGELGHRIRQAVLKKGVRMVIIDSINGYMNSMPGERSLNLQLHELLSFLNQQGVITIMVLAQQGVVGSMASAVDLTYLADTVVLFRYFEARGSVKQALSMIKKRSGNHERTIREIKIRRGGFEVGPPLTNMHGVLTGVPTLHEPRPGMSVPVSS